MAVQLALTLILKDWCLFFQLEYILPCVWQAVNKKGLSDYHLSYSCLNRRSWHWCNSTVYNVPELIFLYYTSVCSDWYFIFQTSVSQTTGASPPGGYCQTYFILCCSYFMGERHLHIRRGKINHLSTLSTTSRFYSVLLSDQITVRPIVIHMSDKHICKCLKFVKGWLLQCGDRL